MAAMGELLIELGSIRNHAIELEKRSANVDVKHRANAIVNTADRIVDMAKEIPADPVVNTPVVLRVGSYFVLEAKRLTLAAKFTSYVKLKGQDKDGNIVNCAIEHREGRLPDIHGELPHGVMIRADNFSPFYKLVSPNKDSIYAIHDVLTVEATGYLSVGIEVSE